MNPALAAETCLRDGDPVRALKLLQAQVRTRPGDAKLRIFLFQLLCVLGQWQRALTQLDTAASLDVAALPMQQTYAEAIKCELLRAEIFQGRKVPMVFGQPESWLALLIEGLLREGQGEAAQAQSLRDRAFAEAPASSGSVDGKPFEWIADADMRLGPVLETIINGRYYWVPFARLSRIDIEAPLDLRDAVWMPAHLRFENGGESVALIPTRYAGSEAAGDNALALSRKTLWETTAAGTYVGLGQRILTTDDAEIPLMEIRSIVFDPVQAELRDAGQ